MKSSSRLHEENDILDVLSKQRFIRSRHKEKLGTSFENHIWEGNFKFYSSFHISNLAFIHVIPTAGTEAMKNSHFGGTQAYSLPFWIFFQNVFFHDFTLPADLLLWSLFRR